MTIFRPKTNLMKAIHTILSFSMLCSWATATAFDKTPAAIVIYLNKQGPIVQNQLLYSGSSRKQIALHYCANEGLKGGTNDGANNASFVHCSIALFNRVKNKGWAFAGAADIGQGSLLTFDEQIITAESVRYAPEDPLCCPSTKERLVFSTERGKLILENRQQPPL